MNEAQLLPNWCFTNYYILCWFLSYLWIYFLSQLIIFYVLVCCHRGDSAVPPNCRCCLCLSIQRCGSYCFFFIQFLRWWTSCRQVSSSYLRVPTKHSDVRLSERCAVCLAAFLTCFFSYLLLFLLASFLLFSSSAAVSRCQMRHVNLRYSKR